MWPRISYETYKWVVSDPDAYSKRQLNKHQGGYQAAVPAAIVSLPPCVFLPALTNLVHDAVAELIRFDSSYGTDLLPYSALTLRSEAAASSRIENLTSSAKNIAIAEVYRSTATHNSRIIVDNTSAMKTAIECADTLDRQTIIEIHRTLLEKSRPEIVGGWRTQQVWIGGTSLGPHQAAFVPPHHTLVEEQMQDLLAFMARSDFEPLTQAAIAHAQFETIHPFHDGNGRTGRALIHSLFKVKGLTENICVPLSAGLVANTDAYFNALTAYRNGDVSKIVEQLALAILESVRVAKVLASEVENIKKEWEKKLVARAGSAARRLLPVLLSQPAVTSRYVQETLEVSATNAGKALAVLERYAIVKPLDKKTRNRIWLASEVVDLLEHFSANIQQRR